MKKQVKNSTPVATTKEIKSAYNCVFANISSLVNIIQKHSKKGGEFSECASLIESRFGRFDKKNILAVGQFLMIDGLPCKYVSKPCADVVYLKGVRVVSISDKYRVLPSGAVVQRVPVTFNNLVDCLESYRKIAVRYESIWDKAEKECLERIERLKVVWMERELETLRAKAAQLSA